MDKKTFNEFLHSVADIKYKKSNTIEYKSIKLKPQIKNCALGCGKVVKNQIIEKRLCEHPVTHWRTRCSHCSSYVSPDGESFIKGGYLVQTEFLKHFSNKKKPQG